MTLTLFSGVWGKMIHQKNLPQIILWHCPCKHSSECSSQICESVSAYVAWRAGKSNRVVVPARQAVNWFLGSSKKVYKYGLFIGSQVQGTQTANKWPVRIWESNINDWFQWNCAALLFPKQNYNVYVYVSQFPHSCICERFIYSQDWSAYFIAEN
jgi:hypothetical protein